MKYPFALAAIAVTAALFIGCEDTGTNTPVKFIPAPPSNLMALSLSETSIRIKWTPSPSESNAEFKGYRIIAKSGTQTFNPITTGKGETIVDLLGLDAGKIYDISVMAYTNDTVSSAITISWAGAKRFRGIRAYETASVNGSGIRLSDGMNLTIANGTQWDVCLDTRTVGGQDNWAFGSPQASTYTDDNGRFIRGAQAGQPAKVTVIFSDSTAQGYTPSSSSLTLSKPSLNPKHLAPAKSKSKSCSRICRIKPGALCFMQKPRKGILQKFYSKQPTAASCMALHQIGTWKLITLSKPQQTFRMPWQKAYRRLITRVSSKLVHNHNANGGDDETYSCSPHPYNMVDGCTGPGGEKGKRPFHTTKL